MIFLCFQFNIHKNNIFLNLIKLLDQQYLAIVCREFIKISSIVEVIKTWILIKIFN